MNPTRHPPRYRQPSTPGLVDLFLLAFALAGLWSLWGHIGQLEAQAAWLDTATHEETR